MGKALLQVAAIGFFLNAMTAYAACDMTMYASENTAEERIPCHGIAGGTATEVATADVDLEDCCSACVSVALFASLGVAAQFTVDDVETPSASVLVSSGFDPPFRPPIAILS